MPMRPIRLLLLTLLLLPVTVAANTALLRDVLYQDQGSHIDLDIRLGISAEVAQFDAEDQLVTVRLKPAADGSAGWLSQSLQFEEDDRLLEEVTLEGSDRKGFELRLRFTAPVRARLLPQFDDRQVLLKLATARDYQKMSRFGRPERGDPYVINLESRHRDIPRLEDLPRGFADSQTLYVTDFEQDGVLWHRLRMGFFANETDARRTLRALERFFPEAWLDRASDAEVLYGEAFRINPPQKLARSERAAESAAEPEVRMTVALATPATIAAEPAPEPQPVDEPWPQRTAVEPAPPGRAEALLLEGRAAYEAEDWASAINRYAAAVEAGEEPYRQQALEMLGVARELNDQPAHAKRYYEMYLSDYAGTDGAGRVAQRLAALTAFDRPSSRTSSRKLATVAQKPAWAFGAQLSQFYQRHDLKVDQRSTVPINGVFNDFNLLASRDGDDLDQEVRVTLSYLLDFSDNERIKGRELQVSGAYWEGFSDRLRSGVRVGRQSAWQTGALGRFDGVDFTYRPTDRFGLGLTGGYLIDASYDTPNGDRPFFGLSGEYLSDSGNLSLRPFYVQQYVDGLIDRQALGLQSQLYTERVLLFSLVDYDLHHSALNNLTLSGNVTVGRSQLIASYEHRKSPYLTTRNALMGQSIDDLTELEAAILELSLEEIASDRTATSNTMRLGWNSRLADHWTLSADVVATDFSRTESSADVIGLEPHKTLYSSFQIRSTDPFGRGSYSGVMIRVANSETSDTTSLYWDNRLLLAGSWYVYPRLRVDHRTFTRNDDEQWTVRPSLRVDYRLNRALRFELETGYEWSTREMVDRTLDITGLYVRAGYRAIF